MAEFHVVIKAGANIDQIEIKDKTWYIKIREKAVDGNANEYLIEYLAKKLKTAKSKVHILKGHNSKYKLIKVEKDV